VIRHQNSPVLQPMDIKALDTIAQVLAVTKMGDGPLELTELQAFGRSKSSS